MQPLKLVYQKTIFELISQRSFITTALLDSRFDRIHIKSYGEKGRN